MVCVCLLSVPLCVSHFACVCVVFNQDSLYRAMENRLKRVKGNADRNKVFRDANSLEFATVCSYVCVSFLCANLCVCAGFEAERAGHRPYGGRTRRNVRNPLFHVLTFVCVCSQKRRQKFSRRRSTHTDADIDFINERNRVFNKKIKRAFDKYTVEIRNNLERGTAL